jgi:hypothetical protein
MRITEVRRAIEEVAGIPADKVIETKWCVCVTCKARIDNADPREGASKVKAYRISPDLWGLLHEQERGAA